MLWGHYCNQGLLLEKLLFPRESVTPDESQQQSSSPFCYFSHCPLNTWILLLLSPFLSIKHANNLINHFSRFACGDREEGGRHPNKPFYPCKCFLYCLSLCLETLAAQAQRGCLTIAHLRLWGGSDIYYPLQ